MATCAAPSARRHARAAHANAGARLPGGGGTARSFRTTSSFKGVLVVNSHPSSPAGPADPVYALPSFLSPDAWHHIVASLQLSPQQARIVALILQGKQDKEIAAELHLNRYTIRTYLRRVFDRVELEDRMELVLRIFAICSNRWQAAVVGVPLTGDT